MKHFAYVLLCNPILLKVQFLSYRLPSEDSTRRKTRAYYVYVDGYAWCTYLQQIGFRFLQDIQLITGKSNSWCNRYTSRRQRCIMSPKLCEIKVVPKQQQTLVPMEAVGRHVFDVWRFKNTLMSISRTTQGAFYKTDVILPALCLPPAFDVIIEVRNYPLTWTLDWTLQVVDRAIVIVCFWAKQELSHEIGKW